MSGLAADLRQQGEEREVIERKEAVLEAARQITRIAGTWPEDWQRLVNAVDALEDMIGPIEEHIAHPPTPQEN